MYTISMVVFLAVDVCQLFNQRRKFALSFRQSDKDADMILKEYIIFFAKMLDGSFFQYHKVIDVGAIQISFVFFFLAFTDIACERMFFCKIDIFPCLVYGRDSIGTELFSDKIIYRIEFKDVSFFVLVSVLQIEICFEGSECNFIIIAWEMTGILVFQSGI